ncbi:ABC transporter substrate-binding protein [Actinophytocola algeriensis]|uniref:Alpha-glucoside transport system substrate-binding protein n=1 Tax=Actinophytocola algeriensis TaxID=1768010 RepID=A0A7W7VH68_9PSEU|nr:ABC transporter substrate-binding protein [Actinophytocola algeriensis]MBB4910093.1 alpha-glucoside transport system substrate-binding protein [Actinophytocola algeriensis]MBE1476083.1 alpha-glucoside transport system substrate-binding protein [Actinophytocola algeriensis]
MPSRGFRRRALLRAAVVGPLAAAATGCADLNRPLGLGGFVRVAVSWSATELAAFQRVLGPRLDDCQLVPLGDDIDAAFGANVAGRPDIVALPQPKLVSGKLTSLAPLPPEVWDRGYDGFWSGQLPSRDGRHYALPFKVAHSSVVWYRKRFFAEHGLTPPTTWVEWLELNERIVERTGTAALALGGADGWFLARFFENVLLRQFDGVYAALVAGERGAWGSADVRTAFAQVARMWGGREVLAGGAERALVAQYPEAVLEVFRYHRAAMVPAPDFAESVIRAFDVLDDDVGTFTFPAAPGLGRRLVVSGDLLVLTAPASEEAENVLRHLADPAAPVPWIRDTGGFIAANPGTDLGNYSPTLRVLARQLTTHDLHFGLTDKVPLGGVLQTVLQDLLRALAAGTEPAAAASAASSAMAGAAE